MVTTFLYLFSCIEVFFMYLMFIIGIVFLVFCVGGITVRVLLCVDSLSFIILTLTILVFLSSILAVLYERLSFSSWTYVLFLLSILFFSLFLLFIRSDLFFFYVFFELTILPIFIVIIGWGYSFNRLQASLYIIFFMLLSSYPFLFSFFHSYYLGLSLNFYLSFFNKAIFSIGSFWWFLSFVVFAVKLPIFLLHLWLPKAHVDAPLLGSIILAGILLKIGGFGIIKISLLFFSSYIRFGWFVSCFCLVGSLFTSIICLRQLDLKSLVAYSSVVHMGPVLRCFFFLSHYRLFGSFILMLSHGFCSCGLFFLLNFLTKFYFSRRSFILRGCLILSSITSFFWVLFCFFNIAFPPSFNFFSEVLTIFSCLFYSNLLLFLFFTIILFVGFYCVTIMVTLSHGSSPQYFFSGFLFVRVSDLCVCLIYFFFLRFFIFFIPTLFCQFSF